jgi:hypothetical protein
VNDVYTLLTAVSHFFGVMIQPADSGVVVWVWQLNPLKISPPPHDSIC